MARKLKLLKAEVDFYLADTFAGVVKASGKDAFYGGGEHADTSQEIVVKLISGKYQNYKILKGIFRMTPAFHRQKVVFLIVILT